MKSTIHDDINIVENELIMYKGRIYLVHSSQLKLNILRTFDDAPMDGHLSFFKTYRKIWQRFKWKKLKNEVLKYVIECPTC